MCGAVGSTLGSRAPRAGVASATEVLGAQVRRILVRSDRTHGARHVWHDVMEQGQTCGLLCIERPMREQALRARPRRRRLPEDLSEHGAVADNMLDLLQADAPNRKWVADFTYIWTAEGWLYVSGMSPFLSAIGGRLT